MGAVVFFAFILFVMGGVTAYMGDRLGSYIGKKRHSTFGLRPRHTAMLWTVVSGGVIAVGTLLLFLALNRAFSTALVRGPQLLASNSLLERQNRALTRRNLAADRQAEESSRRAGRAQAQAEAAQRQAAEARQTLRSVQAGLGRAENSLAQSRRTLASRQATLAQAQARLFQTQRGLETTRGDLAAAQAQVRLARHGVAAAHQQYQIAGNQVVRANRSVLALVIRQDALHAENARLAGLNRTQEDLLQASQGRPLVFRREDELGRVVVTAAQPPDALRRVLAVFLDKIELAARQRGAGGTDSSPAIIIPATGDNPNSVAQAREAALDALSQNIATQSGLLPSIVVVADARFNTFKGEVVKLDLRPYANVLVFPKGTVIAQGALDGSQPEEAVLRNVQAFLTGQVRAAALQRGLIPVRDPQTGEPRVGRPIDTSEALALVKQIQQAGPNAHLTAAAAADTYSADLLRLSLHVTPEPVRAPPGQAARQ